MRTKWQIMEERRDRFVKMAIEAQEALDALGKREFGIECSGCGLMMATEEDFAKHFLIPEEWLVNIGRCPVKLAEEKETDK